MSPIELLSFPEELLERILTWNVVAPLAQQPRPHWHRPGPISRPSTDSAQDLLSSTRGRLAPLLVCKKFLRIATPLFYHTIHILSAEQLHILLSNALLPNPILALNIRHLTFKGIWGDGGKVLRMCENNIRVLDITLDIGTLGSQSNSWNACDKDAEDFCSSLKFIQGLTHLTICKPSSVYLSHSRTRHVLWEIATAMQNWDQLEVADIAFRLSDDPVNSSSTKGIYAKPVAALTDALKSRKRLHTFTTLLPSVWNEVILRVSENPALQRIILCKQTTPLYSAGYLLDWGGVTDRGIAGTSLFLTQAKQHPRLSELIGAGTPISRSRAYTLGAPAVPLTPGSHTRTSSCSLLQTEHASPPFPISPHSASQTAPSTSYQFSCSSSPSASSFSQKGTDALAGPSSPVGQQRHFPKPIGTGRPRPMSCIFP